MPIAYFSRVKQIVIQANLIIEAINLLCKESIIVRSVTFDGPQKSLATARKLRCKIGDMQGSFPHLCRPDLSVYVILDIYHMIKLAQNALGDMKVFLTSTGEKFRGELLKLCTLFNKMIFAHRRQFKNKAYSMALTQNESFYCCPDSKYVCVSSNYFLQPLIFPTSRTAKQHATFFC